MTNPTITPRQGLDEAWAKADPTAAKQWGASFIIGYISQDNTGKNLTADDVRRIHAAGLDIVLNFEYNPQSAVGGAYNGTQDALIAVQRARELGAPRGTVIYFSIDFAVGSDRALATVADYIRAAATVCINAGYLADAYGGITTIGYLFDHQLIAYGWQTYAWSNGEWDNRAALRQVRNGVTVAGANVDQDSAVRLDFGQWRPDGSVGIIGAIQGSDPMFLAKRNSDGQYFVCDGMRSRPITPDEANVLAYLATEYSGAAITLMHQAVATNPPEWEASPNGSVPGIVRLGWVPAFGELPEAAPSSPPPPAPEPAPVVDVGQALIDLWTRIAVATEAIAHELTTVPTLPSPATAPVKAAETSPAAEEPTAADPIAPAQPSATATDAAPVDTQP